MLKRVKQLYCQLVLSGHPIKEGLAVGRLVNRSGLRLSYWTDDVGEDGEVGCAYTLNAWEESPLLVDPVERTVIIPDTQQQASYFAASSTLPATSS